MSARMLAAWHGKEATVWLERPLTSERQHDPMPGRMRRSRWLWLAALCVAAGLLRVGNIDYGLPTVDVPLTFFILVATYFLYMSYSQQRQRDFVLLGSFAGLATATKSPAGLLLITCMLLSPLFTRKEEQPLWSPSFLFSPRSPLVLSVGAFIVSYSLAAPYTYLDFSTFWQEFKAHRQLFSQGWLGSEGISNFFGCYAKLLLVEEWGVFTGLLCLVGSGTLAFQRPWLAFVLFTFPGLYYCVFGLSTTGFARYALSLQSSGATLRAGPDLESARIEWHWAHNQAVSHPADYKKEELQ